MKVDRNSPRGVTGPDRSTAERAAGQAGNPQVSGGKPPEDGVQLSEKARLAHVVRKRLREAPQVRMDLVLRLKEQIESGRYDVAPHKVAERILRSGVLDE